MECLDSTWISSKGKFINQFEESFSEYLGIKYSAAVSNGTVALHVALLALGIGKGDEVIVPTFTYIASVNSICYTGAVPVFVDSKEDTWQMDPEDVKKKITSKTKACPRWRRGTRRRSQRWAGNLPRNPTWLDLSASVRRALSRIFASPIRPAPWENLATAGRRGQASPPFVQPEAAQEHRKT